MWTTVTQTLLFLCSFMVICPFVRAPLPDRDERSSVAIIETLLDCVNTVLCDIQRSARTQPLRDAMLDMQRERDTCCVEKRGTYERWDAKTMSLQIYYVVHNYAKLLNYANVLRATKVADNAKCKTRLFITQ